MPRCRAKLRGVAKTTEATEAMNAEIAALKKQMADGRTDFALRSAGARNVKADRALLDDCGGDVGKLHEAELWMFADTDATSQDTSHKVGGAIGLEPAGVAGGSDGRYMRRWERIPALAEDKETYAPWPTASQR